ncbi:UDP-N-acetylglucosamine--N-acetylmuramyl-(pentapeptide) pyrophosphoryl-undecaprenol N-acetylglucosamine transferase [Candidatus Gottesmanbacteria bacterium]|nr:UDP-N-acetylglucosamine--N-acetylmuramyl-(pentapeptide) pyrophosphoryl-undecaprenol N-acetylglucosamine transferase [Candidatus Gottesmanbacteria bacterium]
MSDKELRAITVNLDRTLDTPIHSPEDGVLRSEELLSGQSSILYLLSTKKGFGHITRAVAIAHRLPSQNPICFGVYPHAREFISGNLRERNISFIDCSYDFSQSNYDREQNVANREKFFQDNLEMMSLVDKSNLIVTDFIAPIVFIRDAVDAKEDSNTLLVGVYHSFNGYHPLDEELTEWQSKTAQVVDALDVVFLVEPLRKPRSPYLTQRGTLVIPCGPVVRDVTKDRDTVKKDIGLSPTDEFVLIQAGMKGSKEIKQIIETVGTYLKQTGLKAVILRGDMDIARDRYDFDKQIVILPETVEGHNLVAAARGVIAKPGMQTLSECIAYKTPLLFVSDPHPERKLKIEMLRDISGRNIPTVLDLNEDPSAQIRKWLEHHDEIQSAYSMIACNGAQVIADTLQRFQREGLRTSGVQPPIPRHDVPPGKVAKHLSLAESAEKIRLRKTYIEENIIDYLKDAHIQATVIGFGGVAKGILREESDTDILMIINETDLDMLLPFFLKFQMAKPLTSQRVTSLRKGEYDALRLKTDLPDGSDLNISLMTKESYGRIFSALTRYFKEELGDKLSGQPYHLPDFHGQEHAFPKVYEVQVGSDIHRERRSPAIVSFDNRIILGVKERMLLTSEVWFDGLKLGDPTRKLMRGVARAICYWNNLYEYGDDGKITGLKPDAFNPSYFFRILRDPVDMYTKQKYRMLKNLYFNELRRIDFITRYKAG